MREEISGILKGSGISPTPVRILVFRVLQESLSPLSLSDLETLLESVDKSTISRTLSTFKDHRLIHTINDGSGSAKYELCASKSEEAHEDSHIHFRCLACGITKCLYEVKIPEVKLPDGFVAKDSNFVISGLCSECNKKL